MIEDTFDYIIIGAGSAGCVMAARLSEDPDVTVLLLEAGRLARWWDFKIHVPAAKGLALKDPALVWGYRTIPQTALAGREIPLYQGRIAGGSSAINGMLFVRGNPGDYNAWARDPALSDWRFDRLLPYFRRLERHATQRSSFRGDAGPVAVRAATGESPLSREFVQAGVDAGHPANDDINGARQDGFGLMDMNVAEGRRVSAWDAYVEPARKRRNLTVLPGAEVVSLRLRRRRCTGLDALVDGHARTFRATCETIVSAGALGSPTLLMRSGIGPADHLRALGIDVVHELAGVGENLHDHVQVCVLSTCTKPVTLQPLTRKGHRYASGLRWLLTRRGWAATNHFEAGAFLRSGEAVKWPDIQLQFSPHAITRFATGLPPETHGYQVHAGATRPKSRGRLRLRSARHDDPPLVDPGYMTHPDDWTVTRSALRRAREVLAQEAFAPYRGAEVQPGPKVRTDAEIDAYIRETADSGYHPCGTCKMGSGQDTVVDGELRVQGLEGLRVVDSSVIPSIPSGNINAPTLMIAEAAADRVRGRIPEKAG